MFTTKDYWEYLEAMYKWLESTRKLITWNIYHTKTMSKHSAKQHQQLMKYMSAWLLTGHYAHCHDKNEEHKCPYCHTVYEKDLHILHCPHPNRAAK
jgi:sarcosine oxidase delta subunit